MVKPLVDKAFIGGNKLNIYQTHISENDNYKNRHFLEPELKTDHCLLVSCQIVKSYIPRDI